jgi:hypothetical protein
MKYLDALLRFFNENDYTHREDVAIIISDVFQENPDISLESFTKKIKEIKRDFFRINGLSRTDFSETLYVLLNGVKKDRPDITSKLNEAKAFISQHFEIGFNGTEHLEERAAILKKFSIMKTPHAVLMKAFNKLLDKIRVSYQINLHGVKEYSGIDISKSLEKATIGFQIKSRNDDISECVIRYETSKAQDCELDGFVLIYASKRNKKVETSIQAAYHHFRILRDSKRMYCAIVYPELLAELFRTYSISIQE